MGLYAISDLHLSLKTPKPMDIFGEKWRGHHETIKKKWTRKITAEDTVLLPGDISWGMRAEDAMPDLQLVSDLPGTKILVQGNHDYWWHSAEYWNARFPQMIFIRNSFYFYKSENLKRRTAICGTRGWICPNSEGFTKQDEKIYRREAGRLQFSMDAAMRAEAENIVVMLHFPPCNEKCEPSLFTDLIGQYPVSVVVFGHLHGEVVRNHPYHDCISGVSCILVSVDAVGFDPVHIF